MHSGKVVGLVLGALLVALAVLMLVPALADLVADADPKYSISDMAAHVIDVLKTRPDVLEEV